MKEAEHWRWLRRNQDTHPNLREILKDYESMRKLTSDIIEQKCNHSLNQGTTLKGAIPDTLICSLCGYTIDISEPIAGGVR